MKKFFGFAFVALALASCGQEKPATETVSNYAISFPSLVSETALKEHMGDLPYNVLGAQYYVAGGTGGSNFMSATNDFNSYFSSVREGYEHRRVTYETNVKSIAEKYPNKDFSALSIDDALQVLALNDKIEAFGTDSQTSDMYYAVYIKATRQQAEDLAKRMNGDLHSQAGAKLLGIRPEYVNAMQSQYIYNNTSNISSQSSFYISEARKILNKFSSYESPTDTYSEIASLAPESSTTLTWWPAGNLYYHARPSLTGVMLADVSFSFAWGNARLTNMRSLKSDSGRYNLDGFEGDIAFIDAASTAFNESKVYTSCDAYTSLPSAYDDCWTAGVQEAEGVISMGFGSFTNVNYVANQKYDANIVLYPNNSAYLPAKGHPLRNSVTMQALHCYTSLTLWNCGSSDDQKITKRVIDANNMSLRYGYDYSQSWN